MDFLSEIIYRERFLIENGSHTRDAIIIVLEGKFECTINGRSYTAGPGDICIFHANNSFQRKVLQPIRCVYIQFEPFPFQLPPGLLKTADPLRTENSISHLAQAVADEHRELSEHFLRDILLMHQFRISKKQQSDEVVAGCITYFRHNHSRHITLDTLAKEFSVSKQGLIQKFRKQTGKTPMEYLSALRISQSKLLLKNTNLPVSKIAESCGFENVYYFSNCFKRAAGVSPSAYRKMVDL